MLYKMIAYVNTYVNGTPKHPPCRAEGKHPVPERQHHAQLASAPTCKKRLADLCDAFSIGGTKNGAQFGEALVILNDALKSERVA